MEAGDLLDAEAEVIVDALELWAPGTDVACSGPKRGDPGVMVLGDGDGLDADRLEIGKALCDSRFLLSLGELQLDEALQHTVG